MIEVISVDGREDPAPAPWRPFLRAVGILAMVGLLGLAGTVYVALRTPRGMRLDREAMDAVSSPVLTLNHLYDGLTLVSVGSVGVSLVACAMLALVRHRFDLAFCAVVIIGGANLTTQILKFGIFPRVNLRPGPDSMPSGHTTVALSIALAAVIVAPTLWRSTVAIGVTATAALVGVATVLGRWHLPSDVIGAVFVCLVWAALGLLAAALVRHRHGAVEGSAPVHLAALVGAAMVGGLLVSWGVRPQPGLRDLGLGIVALGSIGLACAACVAAVAQVADRHLG